MNKQIKQLWVDALRSGVYPQTKSRLKDEIGYCCLGVLCEIYQKEYPKMAHWKEVIALNGTTCFAFTSEMEGYNREEVALLPGQVKDWADLDYISPAIEAGGVVLVLTRLNDEGITFTEIANLIDKHL